MNVKERHVKGHQNRRGNVIGSGPYQSSFTFDNFSDDWYDHVTKYVIKLQERLESQMTMSTKVEEEYFKTTLQIGNIKDY